MRKASVLRLKQPEPRKGGKETSFLLQAGDVGFDAARRSDRVSFMMPAPNRDPVPFELREALLLIGLGMAVGSWLTWSLLGIVIQ